MTEHNTSDNIEVEAVDSIESPEGHPDNWLELAKEPMPEDHIRTVEERVGWDNINSLDDLGKVLDALDEDQLEGNDER